MNFDISWVPWALAEYPYSLSKCMAIELDGTRCMVAAVVLPGKFQSNLCPKHEIARILLRDMYHARKAHVVISSFLRVLQMHTIFRGRTDPGHMTRISYELNTLFPGA